MKKLSLAYFGSPSFSADLLEKILTDKTLPIEVKLVVTQQDKPAGRKGIITPTPVKLIAEKYNISVFDKLQVTSLPFRSSDVIGTKEGYMLHEIDLCLVYAYGEIIPKELLSLPKYGFWNIHPSLLPKYRGPSPIAYPIINRDTETGVTLIQMDEQIDHGPIIDQTTCPIDPNEKRPDLEKKLTEFGFSLFKNNVVKLQVTSYKRQPRLTWLKVKDQDHSKATYTKLLTKQDGFIKFEQLKKILTSNSLLLTTFYNRFRGLYPWPGIWTLVKINGQEKRLKIIDMHLVGIGRNLSLQINRVQLEGKKEVDFEIFQKAYL